MAVSSRILVFIILFFFLTLSATAIAQSPEIQSLIKLERAQRAMVDEKYDKALGIYEEILQLTGGSPDISYKAAHAAYKTQQYEKGQQLILQTLATDDILFQQTTTYVAAFGLAASIEDAIEDLATQAKAQELARVEAQQKKEAREQAQQEQKARALAEKQALEKALALVPKGMAYIYPGEFLMGSTFFEVDRLVRECAEDGFQFKECWGRFQDEQPRHPVTMHAFYLDRYEVTNQSFEKFVLATKHKTTAERKGWGFGFNRQGKWANIKGAHWRQPDGGLNVFDAKHGDHPVVSVSWDDANAYCQHYGKRLPTEAEWEHAARAGTLIRYWWGNEWTYGNTHLGQVANVRDKTAERVLKLVNVTPEYDDSFSQTAPVGSYEANPWGLYDMNGNVVEWTADWYTETYYQNSPTKNPQGPAAGKTRVVRGGSWIDLPLAVRSASRFGQLPEYSLVTTGFRCAQDVK